MEDYEEVYTIQNRLGLHLRAANKLARLASTFKSQIWLCKDGLEVDAKSIMGITLLVAGYGSKVTVKAWGEDAVEAVKALGDLINSKFDEE